MKEKHEMCTCVDTAPYYSVCRFCFYGACEKCYLEHNEDDPESSDPYCKCSTIKETSKRD